MPAPRYRPALRAGRRPRRVLAVAALVAALVVGLLLWGLRPTTGCTPSRGIPAQGTLVGAAVGGNDDPAGFEAQVGTLAVRRTYWGPDELDAAIATASADLAAGRLPWVSFKFPLPWPQVARGTADDWVNRVASALAGLPGPVWVTFHHEPEGDGDVQAWRAAQEHVAPIVRARAGNAAYAVVLTGWNQVHGPDEFALDRIWPRTTVDIAGFDVYDNPKLDRAASDARMQDFVDELAAWAAATGVRWALAETGYAGHATPERVSDTSWVSRTVARVGRAGAVAFVYFNSNVNSSQDWRLDTAGEFADFRTVLVESVRLTPCPR